ncbi:Trm112 family protein [Lysobacter sp. A3-1-A15]|uniref:Trm112 family protein n=1 Tax=Novilysobacter viscosus TaxID=3098602 RepID=UPI002ED7D260
MDRKLLDLLVCPTTRQPLQRLDATALAALNSAAAAGTLRKADGTPQSGPVREALATRDHRHVYRLDDGIPVLLAEEAIITVGVAGFPGA